MDGLGLLKSPLLLGFTAPDAGTSLHGLEPAYKTAKDGDPSLESTVVLQGPLLGLVKATERGKDMTSSPESHSATASRAYVNVLPEIGMTNAEGVTSPPSRPSRGLGSELNIAAQSSELGLSIASIHEAVKSFQATCGDCEHRNGFIRLIHQSKEWSALDTARLSIDSEQPQASDRRPRYVKEVPQSPDIGFPSRSTRSGIDPNVLRCWSWCFFFVEMWLSLACIALFLHRKHWIAVACLGPPHLLFMCLEVYLMRHDRAFLQWCQAALRGLGPLRRALLEALVVVYGCLNCFPLIRARRCWRQRGMRLSVVDEIEAQCIRGCGASVDGARFDSHLLFLMGVPRMVVLTNLLTGRDSYSPTEIVTICTLTVLSLISVVQAVMNFDYYASRWIRKQYELEQSIRFHIVHYAYRLFEVTGRILILVAVTKAFRFSIPSVTAVLSLDYLLGIMTLLWVTGFTPGSPQMILVLSVSIYVVDVCRYIDEHGITRQAKKVSNFLYWVRIMQLLALLLLYQDVKSQSHYRGLLLSHGAEVLPVLAIVACGACLALRKFTRMGHTGVDLFLASKYGQADLLVEILASGCDVNMVQMDNTRETPLHAAASRGQASCVGLLLQHGADPTLLDAHGENPLHRACRRGDAQTIQLLLSPPEGSPCSLREDYKRSVIQVNNEGRTPLQVLRKNSPWLLAQMLVEAQQVAACAGPGEDVPGGTSQLSRSISKDVQSLAERVFGQVVRHSRARFLFSPEKKAFSSAAPGLASFMFSTGIGEQLAEYLDSDDQGQGQKLQLSSLRTQGLLGAGAFGRVFKVLDVETGEIYAMKLQRRERTTKFAVREAQALHQYSHAYIVRLVQIFQTQNFYGLLMELCEGSLNACILEALGPGGRAEGLPEARAARYAACVALALEYLHGLEIIFRDLKPDNILMTVREKGDVAKLTDFGLARSIKPPLVDTPKAEQSTSLEDDVAPSEPSTLYASAVCGTPRFMAPEIFDESIPEGENTEQRLRRLSSRDWYALGCCLHLMLLGEDGGIKITTAGRGVLLPPTPEELPAALRRAAKAFRISEDAFQLVASLTAPVAERAGAEFVRSSPLLHDAVEEMEAEARWYEAEGRNRQWM